jgi:hypothetical protein
VAQAASLISVAIWAGCFLLLYEYLITGSGHCQGIIIPKNAK